MFGKRFSRALAVTTVASLVMATAAFADNTIADGDIVAGIQDLDLGTICVDESNNGNVAAIAVRSGGTGPGNNKWSNGAVLTASAAAPTIVDSPSDTSLTVTVPSAPAIDPSAGTASGNKIGLATNWLSLANNTQSAAVTVNLALAAGDEAGPFEATVVFSLSGAGTLPSGTSGTLVRTDTLTVTASISDQGSCAPAPSDSTPPTITYTLNPASADGTNGWYKSDVTLTWTVTEDESPSSLATTGCDDQNITADQAAATYSCSATSDGGDAGPVDVTIKRDRTAPTVEFTSAAPAVTGAGPNAAGWYKSDVVATFTATDNLSGFDADGTLTSTDTNTTNDEGIAVTVGSPAFIDRAGNSVAANAATSAAFKVDKTAPVVVVTGVTDGTTYTLGSVPAAGCSTTETLSGVKTAASLSSSGGPVGSITATCSAATDNADNTGSPASVTYTVIFDFAGFFRPVDNLPALNVAKAGSAIPLKFSLSGNQGLNILAAGSPTSKVSSCDAAGAPDVIEETVTAGQSSLSYDSTADQYVYVWKTDKGWAGTCRTLTVKLADGTIHQALFKLTK